jgi:hypothetical protein
MENKAPRAQDQRAAPPPSAPADMKADVRAERASNPGALPAAAPPASPRDANRAAPHAGSQDANRAAPQDPSRGAPSPPAAGAPSVSVAAASVLAENMYTGQYVGQYAGQTIIVGSTINGWRGSERPTKAQPTIISWAKILERNVSIDAGEIRRASLILKHRRLLILSGEPALGKAWLASAIIRRAAEDGRPLREVLEFEEIAASVNVQLDAWANDPEYRDRAFVFKDAFAHPNASLRSLSRRLNREQLEQLTLSLGEANMFIVLTADAIDTDALPPEWRGAADQLHCALSRPSETVLQGYLSDEIARFAAKPFGHGTTLHLDDTQREQLVRSLRTIPRIIQFSSFYFDAIASGRTTITAAVRDFDNRKKWFMTELRDGNPAAWCLTLATCLLHADPTVKQVPWAASMSLANLLARHLRNCIPSWKGRQPAFIDPDETLLAAARMTMVDKSEKESEDEWHDGDQVRFEDRSYGTELWRVLADSGRALLSTIYPALATHAGRRGTFWLDTMTVLGRIGAIDGTSRLGSPLHNLATATTPLEHVALGRLLVGVLASGNSACFETCVDLLRATAAACGPRPFMLAMREVGLSDLSRAVREIVNFTEKRIRPLLSDLDAFHRVLVAALGARRDAVGVVNESIEITRQFDRDANESLREIFGLIFDDAIVELLDAARFAIIGLCFGRIPVEVCNAFLPHLDSDSTISVAAPDPVIGCVVAMLFFAGTRDAVFSVIDRDEFKKTATSAARKTPKLSRVTLGLAEDLSGCVAPFARFLTCTFESLSALPRPIGQPMKAHLLQCVKHWCRDAVRTTYTTPAVKELLCQLRSDTRSPLSDAVTSMLRSDEEFRKQGGPLRTLAVDVITMAAI